MSSQNICFLAEIRKNVNLATPYLELGPVVQSIVSLISLLVTNIFKYIDYNKSYLHFFQQKISIYLPYF